jgi:hypothetical protein
MQLVGDLLINILVIISHNNYFGWSYTLGNFPDCTKHLPL